MPPPSTLLPPSASSICLHRLPPLSSQGLNHHPATAAFISLRHFKGPNSIFFSNPNTSRSLHSGKVNILDSRSSLLDSFEFDTVFCPGVLILSSPNLQEVAVIPGGESRSNGTSKVIHSHSGNSLDPFRH
jgi:hypothetical protein